MIIIKCWFNFSLFSLQYRFTHARIRPFFSGCGLSIESTLRQIVENSLSVEDLPLISVLPIRGQYYSLNNRRLYLFKALRAHGLLIEYGNCIAVRVKTPLTREISRYSVDRCSLQAKLMGAKEVENDDDDFKECEQRCSDGQDQMDKTKFESTSLSIQNYSTSARSSMQSDSESRATTSVTTNTTVSSLFVTSVSKTKMHTKVPFFNSTVLSNIRTLTGLVEKKKYRNVTSELKGWIDQGYLLNEQLPALLLEIGWDIEPSEALK